MALKFCNLFRSQLSSSIQTLDATHEYPAGNFASGTANSAAVIEAGSAKYGSYGLTAGSSNDYLPFTVTAHNIIGNEEGSIGLWLRFNSALATAGAGIVNADDGTSANYITLRVNSTNNDELSFRVRGSSQTVVEIASTDANLSAGNWYFVVLKWSTTTDLARMEIYNDSLAAVGTGAWQAAATNFPVSITRLQLGEFTATACNASIDSVFVGDSWAEADTILANTDILSYTEYGGTSIAPLAMSHYSRLRA